MRKGRTLPAASAAPGVMRLPGRRALVAAAVARRALRRVAVGVAISEPGNKTTRPLSRSPALLKIRSLNLSMTSNLDTVIGIMQGAGALSQEYASPCVDWHVVSFGRLLCTAGENGRATLCITESEIRRM
jgi:hypothetical protein